MKIQVVDQQQHAIVFDLNDSETAQELAQQLPLTTKVENYSNDEKIFYPKALNSNGSPRSNGRKGDLAYFAPWGDVCMFYRDFSSAPGLYNLGHCLSGEDQIPQLSGQITISAISD